MTESDHQGPISAQPAMLIGKQSPEFVAEAVAGGQIKRINSLDLLGKYVLLFFYPNDFSFMCPIELYAI